MAFVDDILAYKRNDEDDFYQILGCDETSSMEQINTEYKNKALIYHPDKNPDDPTAGIYFKKLQMAKETLTDPLKRNKYDRWRASGLALSYEQWMGRHEQSPATHWADRKKKDLMLQCKDEKPSCKDSSNVIWLSNTQHRDVIKKFRSYEI